MRARSGRSHELRVRSGCIGSELEKYFRTNANRCSRHKCRCSPRLHRRNTGVPSSSNPKIGGNAGAPERIRTSGLCLRRAALYPAELRVPGRLSPNGRLAATLPLCQSNNWAAGLLARCRSSANARCGLSGLSRSAGTGPGRRRRACRADRQSGRAHG